jgi:hypothetical protein
MGRDGEEERVVKEKAREVRKGSHPITKTMIRDCAK